MTEAPAPVRQVAKTQPPPAMFSHIAHVTPDAESTADFYTRVLGMELAQAVMDDGIPSTGDPVPYFHIFFRLGDGSTIAFFEAPDLPDQPQPPHPAYKIFNHIAMQVDSVDEVHQWQRHLTEQGLDVLGPVDHKIIYSIYFRDPINDIRLEITTPLTPDWNREADSARDALADWVQAKQAAKDSGKGYTAELSAVIARHRQRID